MKDIEVIEAVQQYVDKNYISSSPLKIEAESIYKTNTVKRFINSWKKYKQFQLSQIEFECALRNFLLVFGAELHIPNYSISDNCKCGLRQHSENKRIYVNYDFPDYVNSNFVRTVFSGISDVSHKSESNKSVLASPFIKSITCFSEFKTKEQQLAVTGALKVPNGYSTLIALPTGGGKSLITQTISYQYDDSLTLIIVPTISLMIDQHRKAIEIIKPENRNEIQYYNSETNVDDTIKSLKKHELRMLFLSPEAIIKNNKLKEALFDASREKYLQNLIIDEAHIIIEWGASFRVDFQCLDAFRKEAVIGNPNIRTFLLSATYTKRTVESLKMFYSEDNKWIEIRLDKLRKEPRFDIIKCKSWTEKQARLDELVFKLPRPMIIYVNTPDDAEQLLSRFHALGISNAKTFTGKTNATDRKEIIERWVNDDFDLLIATCAFGVGVDKPDVRTVLHLYVPSGANQYYQECGRGGRDGSSSLSLMLFTDDDRSAAKSMKQKVLTVDKFIGRWFSMLNSPKTQKRLETIYIDTSVKPDYADKDDFYIEASNADINWNIYVILLLRRAGVLSIKSVEYDGEKYLFVLAVDDIRILYKTDETIDLFTEIRDREFADISVEIDVLDRSLSKVGKRCWSEMFNDVYALTDEYCAGCNSHNKLLYDRTSSRTLKKAIRYPEERISEQLQVCFQNRKEMLIMCPENTMPVIECMITAGVNVVVVFDYHTIQKLESNNINKNTKLLFLTFDNFIALSRDNNYYYLSGSIMFCIGNNEKFASKILSTTQNKEYHRIFVVSEDFYVSDRKKNISELINGTCKQDTIIIKELM